MFSGYEFPVPAFNRVRTELGDEMLEPCRRETQRQTRQFLALFVVQSQMGDPLSVYSQQGRLKKDQGGGHGIEIGEQEDGKRKIEVWFGEDVLEDFSPCHCRCSDLAKAA